MKQRDLFRFGLAVSVLGLLGVSSSPALGRQAEPGVQVWLDDMHAVSYRARVEGDWLVVEATHEPGWHTYSMDNVIRAREKKSGKMRPETELPTVITPLGYFAVRADSRFRVTGGRARLWTCPRLIFDGTRGASRLAATSPCASAKSSPHLRRCRLMRRPVRTTSARWWTLWWSPSMRPSIR